MTDSPLSGRIALITGASGGIGKCIARGLAESGVDLFLTYARHGDDAEEVGEYARGLGRRAVVASADLADPAAPASLVGQANRELGGIDILIANAGTATVRGWQNTDLELWNTTLAINLTAPFLLAQQVLPGMIERRFGRVLFVSSIAGLNGGVVGAHYAASKAGLHGLMHHLAPRVAADGVTVNAWRLHWSATPGCFPSIRRPQPLRCRSLSAVLGGRTRSRTWQLPCCATAI